MLPTSPYKVTNANFLYETLLSPFEEGDRSFFERFSFNLESAQYTPKRDHSDMYLRKMSSNLRCERCINTNISPLCSSLPSPSSSFYLSFFSLLLPSLSPSPSTSPLLLPLSLLLLPLLYLPLPSPPKQTVVQQEPEVAS